MLQVDEDLYPEYYRKSSDYVKGSNTSTPNPFCIGLITAIKTSLKDKLIVSSDICLKVVKFYRPENTNLTTAQKYQADLNSLYISDEGNVFIFIYYLFYKENSFFYSDLLANYIFHGIFPL